MNFSQKLGLFVLIVISVEFSLIWNELEIIAQQRLSCKLP